MSNDMGRIIRGTTQIRQTNCLTHLYNGFSPAKASYNVIMHYIFTLATPWTSSIILSTVSHQQPTALFKTF